MGTQDIFEIGLISRLQVEQDNKNGAQAVDVAWVAENVAKTHAEGRLRTNPSHALASWVKRCEAEGTCRVGGRPAVGRPGTFDGAGRWVNEPQDERWKAIDALVAARKSNKRHPPHEFAARLAREEHRAHGMFDAETLVNWMGLKRWEDWAIAETRNDAERAVRMMGVDVTRPWAWFGGTVRNTTDEDIAKLVMEGAQPEPEGWYADEQAKAARVTDATPAEPAPPEDLDWL